PCHSSPRSRRARSARAARNPRPGQRPRRRLPAQRLPAGDGARAGGFVRNDSEGVWIEVEGPGRRLSRFGKGDALGPDLANLTKRRDRAWVARCLTDPDQMLTEGDPIAKKLFATYRAVRGAESRPGRPEEIDALLLHIEMGSRVVHAASKS